MKAVVDRLEGDYAILLVGEEEIKVDLPQKLLPAETTPGTWLKFSLQIDQETTTDKEREIGDLIDRLKNK
ncbi:DUF3006 domain-containing protein [Natroniella sp. ANB-PHB2]|uniref:DUF3006 domain-containing protein n=1 Tax=Natroniella sp. ANB-PHB2 TaxID=3384444 RepID=UPI0038D39B25